MWKKILSYIALFCLGGACLFFISQGYSNRTIKQLSDDLATIRTTNTELQKRNTILTDTNTRLTIRTTELGEQITRDYQRNQERLRAIQDSLGEITIGLDTATGNIRQVIDGLEQVKKLIDLL